MNEPTIEPGTRHDLGQVRELLARSALADDGLADSTDLLVARAGAAIIGCAALERHGADALLRSVAVDLRLRGSGVGRRLVEAALALAARRRLRAVYLLAETAERFFAKYGFEPIERAELPEAIGRSDQVTRLCPSHARAMRRLVSVETTRAS